MQVTCIIPAYNEAEGIAAVVAAARGCDQVTEIIVVSDGSTDETARRAAAAGADRVLILPRNRGKGGAVAAAVPHARGEILLLLDADLRGLRPWHLSRLLGPICAGRAEMAVGVFTDDPLHGMLPCLSGQRAVQRRLLRHPEVLAGTGFGFELALDRLARREGVRVVEVPLEGVAHRRKRQKYGPVRGLRQEVRASSDLLRQVRRMVIPRRAAARPRPWYPMKARRKPMVLAGIVLVLLILVLAPVFLAPASHAAHVPIVSPLHPGDRLLVVVAHPDDEVVGAGGLVATARRLGVPVSVLVLTNGDSNRLSATLIGRHLRPGPADFRRTGAVRQEESQEGLRRLGVPAEAVFFLGFPDRVLPQVLASEVPVTSPFTRMDHAEYPRVVAPGGPYTAETLRVLLQRVVEQVRPTVVITHAPFDRHGDHQAAYALVSPLLGTVRLYTFLVHAPGFPRPLRFAPREPLQPPAGLAQLRGWSWVEFPLSAEAQRGKQEALNAHRSQLETPYLRLLLGAFVRTNELFAVPRQVNPPGEVSR
ncbi:MAG: PIG-L family deacetylase [Armatimonadota bacterium]|nr:PIG-L family deacetylase [Armatimonadota bacterium]MDR7427816.1 PIG-L family deacetylase [Armatimonadota bacterium]MDR7463133.1 PIG-L family deacetylase [Armatimonadota bacterium]MDR7468880.1 PIG-L family deacetylase [Armatimonadota bacterium]MDR7474879.1 PIG-L family deacetylase [Armatimonadota bacterium]